MEAFPLTSFGASSVTGFRKNWRPYRLHGLSKSNLEFCLSRNQRRRPEKFSVAYKDEAKSSYYEKRRRKKPFKKIEGEEAGGKLPKRQQFNEKKEKEKEKKSFSFFSARSFKSVGATEEMINAFKMLEIERPSHIQAFSYQAFKQAEGDNLLLADHAGSGKTLAYLAPVVQKLRQQELDAGKRLTEPNRPRALVITPTADLANQVVKVCRCLSRTVPFRNVALTGGKLWRTQRKFLDEGVDLVVGTPRRILDHIEAGTIILDKCTTVVLDEVDVLLGHSFDFRPVMDSFLNQMLPSMQFIFVSATIPREVYLDLRSMFASIMLVMGPGLHKSAPGVTEQLIDCSGGDVIDEDSGQRRKAAALISLIQEQKVARTVVFCNKIETCRKAENFLKRNVPEDDPFIVVAHHSAITEDVRVKNLKDFLRPPTEGFPRMVLVCTDRASRGLDTSNVEHVILFDFPRDPSEYVRRVGRTSRGNTGKGLVSVLVLGRQVPVARNIIERNKKGLPIHEVPEEF